MTMLDFYQAHAISPVTQDVSDLPAHFARRAFLYRSLGLPPCAIEGKYVLEIGPGSGQNALYIASLNPDVFTLLEPNEIAWADLCSQRDIFGNTPINGRIEDFESHHEGYDVVLCEGLLGLCGSDPKALLEHVIRHVKPGGVLVITCIDAISDHAEVLRRALAQWYINSSMGLQEKVEALRPVFAPHLATLKGMTRSVDDWIVDNLLNPASIGPTFSIPEACTQLEGRFEVLGSSPRFLTDWRWYKQGQAGNQWAIDAYWAQAHNLIDYRDVEPERDAAQNKRLMETCALLRREVAALEQGTLVGPAFQDIDPAWFGRGQQYLSFVRCQ